MNKRMKKELDLAHLIKTVNINVYINDIERGILKFVNKNLYDIFKKYKTSINDLYYIYEYSTWYCNYFNFNIEMTHNLNWIFLNDYDKIFHGYLTRQYFVFDTLIDNIITYDAVKCFKEMMVRGYRPLLIDLATTCKRNKPKVFQLCMKYGPLWTYNESYLFHICRKNNSDKVLELLKNKYRMSE